MSQNPYPNVTPSKWVEGHFEARHPRSGKSKHLGTFATAEEARAAVLIAQATHLEQKAAGYRATAARLVGK